MAVLNDVIPLNPTPITVPTHPKSLTSLVTGTPVTPVVGTPPVNAAPPLHSQPAAGTPMTVAQRQALLHTAGFNVTVDGVLGPQTKTAWNAYVKGTPASYWNHAWNTNHQAAPPVDDTTPSSTDSGQGAGTPPANTPTRTVAAAKATSTISPVLEQLIENALTPYKPPTPAEMLAQARAIAAAGLQPQLTEVQQEQDQARADAQRNAQFESNLGSALASVLSTQGAQTKDAYHDADKVNAVLASIGAPSGQTISPDKATDLGNVSYGLGGAIPAESLAREGAAFTAAANQEPASMIGLGAQNAANALGAGQDNVTKLAQSLAQLEAQRPGLVSSALTSLQNNAVQNAGLDQNNKLLGFTVLGDLDKLPGVNPITGKPTSTQAGINAKNYDTRVKAAAAAAKVTPSFSASATDALHYKADQYGNPILNANGTPELQAGYGLDKSGNVVKLTTKKTNGKMHGLTTSQVLKLKGTALQVAQNAAQGIPAGGGPSSSWNKSHPDGLPSVGYDQAVTEMEQSGVPAWLYVPALNLYYKDANTNPYAYGPPAPTTPTPTA